jgi:hypothetical protein
MNVNAYPDGNVASELDPSAQESGDLGWPSLILNWQGVPDMPPFESYRAELLPPFEDAVFMSGLLDMNEPCGWARIGTERQ